MTKYSLPAGCSISPTMSFTIFILLFFANNFLQLVISNDVKETC